MCVEVPLKITLVSLPRHRFEHPASDTILSPESHQNNVNFIEIFPSLQLLSFVWDNSNEKKEMFYLTTHSTHFIYGYMVFDIWQRITLIVREGNPLPPNGLLFPINSKGSFICTIP